MDREDEIKNKIGMRIRRDNNNDGKVDNNIQIKIFLEQLLKSLNN